MTKRRAGVSEELRAAAAALGRKGGRARAAALTPERRREISGMGGAVMKAKALARKALTVTHKKT